MAKSDALAAAGPQSDLEGRIAAVERTQENLRRAILQDREHRTGVVAELREAIATLRRQTNPDARQSMSNQVQEANKAMGQVRATMIAVLERLDALEDHASRQSDRDATAAEAIHRMKRQKDRDRLTLTRDAVNRLLIDLNEQEQTEDAPDA